MANQEASEREKGGFPLPCLEPGFQPLVLERRFFRAAVRASGRVVPLKLAVATPSGQVVSIETVVYGDPDAAEAAANVRHAERLVKSLLWIAGGSRIIVAGADELAAALAKIYASDGERAFDYASMTKIYETRFWGANIRFVLRPCAARSWERNWGSPRRTRYSPKGCASRGTAFTPADANSAAKSTNACST